MRAKSTEFRGPCASCGGDGNDKARGGIEVVVSKYADEMGDWICLPCARRLAHKIQSAVKDCRERRKRGEVYRHDKWQKPASTKRRS